jgi:MFS family permease
MVSAKTSFIFSFITILVVLFIGPWSDANGRKIPLLISVSGLVAFSSTMLICYLNLGQLTAIQLSLVAMLPMSITGGGVVFTMSAYSYISDTTNSKDRTVRTGLLSAFIRSGTPFGFAIGGVLTKLGFSTVTSLLTSMSIGVMALLIVLVTVKNPIKEPKEEGPKNKRRPVWVRYNPFLKLVQAFAILFKKRENYGTFLLLIVTFVCYAAPGSGEYSMLYLFVRERLEWNISNYGFFSMYNWLMSAAGYIKKTNIYKEIVENIIFK